MLLLFPGHCSAVLRKLGASPGRIEQLELLFEEPEKGGVVKRNTTALSLSSHKYRGVVPLNLLGICG